MEQTSKLSIVVDTRNAQKQIQSFSTQLKSMERDGLRFNKSLSKLGSSTQFGGMVASIKSAQSALQAFTGTAKNSATALNEFNIAAKSLRTATEGIAADINLAQSAMTKFASASKVVATGLQSVSVAAGQTKTNLSSVVSSLNLASSASGKLSATTKSTRADLLALNVTLTASGNALGKLGQASSAVNTKLSSFNGANFNSLSNSINAAKASLTAFTNTANNMAVAMQKAATAATGLRTATQGIATNLNTAASAAGKIASITTAMNSAKVSAGQFNTGIKGANTSLLTLNATLNTGTAALNRYSQAAITAGQRLNIFGQAATQTQTRLRGLDAGLIAARTNMTQMQTAANGINAIFGNLNTTMARLATATNALNTATTRANTAINQLGGNASNANAQAKGLMGTLSSLQGVLMGSIGSLAGFGILKTADEMQNLNSQIKNITNSESEYLLVKQRVQAIADKNYNDVNATTGLYTSSARALANLGKSQVEALDFTNAVALAMRTGGRSAGEQASAITQLGQAMGANVVQGDEFRSLAENAPILLELVAKRLGVLPGQLKALAADGKITGEVMFDALTQNVDMLEEMAKKMPLTMSQAFTVAKNRYKTYVDSMMNETGGMSGKIASMIGGISANFDTMAKVAIASVGLAFLGVVTNVNLATRAMVLFNAVANANPVLLIVGGFLALSSAIYGTNEVLTISGLVVGDFFTGLGVMISDAEKWWNSYKNTSANAMDETVRSIAETNDKNSKNFLGFYNQTEKGFAGVVQGIGSAISGLTAVFGAFYVYIRDGMADALNAIANGAINTFNFISEQAAKIGIGDGSQVEKFGYNNTNVRDTLAATQANNQDRWQNYAEKLNIRAGITKGPLDRGFSTKQSRGLSFSNATVAGKNSVLANTPAGLPDWLKPAATLSGAPIDAQKALQATMLKQQLATEANTEALKKAKAAQDNIDRANKKAENSTELVRKAVLGGKDWGIYQGGGQYGAKRGYAGGHNGIDIPVKKGTQVYAPEGGSVSFAGSNTGGGGKRLILLGDSGIKYEFLHLDSYDVPAGKVPAGMGIAKSGNSGSRSGGKNFGKKGDGYGDHLHLTTSKNGQKINPTNLKVGKTSYDNTIGKYNSDLANEAEREAKRVSEMAAKEAERIREVQLKLASEYGDKQTQLAIEHGKRLEEIAGSGFDTKKQDDLSKQSEQRMNKELAVYKNGLEQKVSALDDYKKTVSRLTNDKYVQDNFELRNDAELSKPENEALLTAALKSLDERYDYEFEQYQLLLKKQAKELYSFQQTEKDILIGGWDSKIAEAMQATDDLKQVRIDAYIAQSAYELNLFNLSQEQKLLELNKTHMTELAYIREKYRLESELINSSNEPPEIKAAQLRELNTPAKEGLKGVLDRIEGSNPNGAIEQQYQADMQALANANLIELGMLETHKEAKLAIDKSYQDAKRDLMLTQGEALFGNLAGLSKAFLGEQSGLYKGLFAIEKAYTLASVLLKNKEAISKAWASAAFPYNVPAVAAAVAGTAGIASAVQGIMPQGFKAGGYTGNMGVNQVAGAVHGQEYVFDAQATKRIGVDNLNAMRSGKAVGGGDVNITVNNMSSAKVETQKDDNGNIIMTIRDEIKRSWTNTGNPNSFESKQLNRNIQAPRRR